MPDVKTYSEHLGLALAALRKQAGLTQSALAEKMGKSQPRLSVAEKPGAPVPNRLVDQYLGACDRDVFDLALAFLEPDTSEEELADLALRAYRLGELPEDVKALALDAIRNHRRTLQAMLRQAQDPDE